MHAEGAGNQIEQKAAAADVPFLFLVLVSLLTLSFGNGVLIFALL